MTDEMIINFYKKGLSVDYISKQYYKYKNRKQKPIVLNGVTLFPAKIYTRADCRLYVSSVIYHYIINGDLAHTQTTSTSGRGAF